MKTLAVAEKKKILMAIKDNPAIARFHKKKITKKFKNVQL